jgi:ribosome maturation factor RimP
VDKQAFIEELRGIIGGYLEAGGLELVELIYRYEGESLFLRILTDKPGGGITIDECAELNTQIGVVLDEKGPLNQRYVLEVSSPGLDRPLATKSDFLRCVGREARFFLSEPLNGRLEYEGRIARADDSAVYVDICGSVMDIPLGKINKAKQII